MNIANLIIIIVIIVILYIILSNTLLKTNIIYDEILYANDENPDAEVAEASTIFSNSTIKKNVIPNNVFKDNKSTNFMISVWFYIDNWGNNIDNKKNILYLATNYNKFSAFESASGDSAKVIGVSKQFCGDNESDYKNFSICLDSYENNLLIDVKTVKKVGFTGLDAANCDNSGQFTRYMIENINIQKWNCLTVSIDNMLMDVYLDGKLKNSFLLNNIYNIEGDNNNIYLGNTLTTYTDSRNLRGFEGYITRVRFEPNSINSQEAMNIYRAGINKSLLQSVFNRYSLKVSFLEYNKEKGSFSI
jgi:hypothetical protein